MLGFLSIEIIASGLRKTLLYFPSYNAQPKPLCTQKMKKIGRKKKTPSNLSFSCYLKAGKSLMEVKKYMISSSVHTKIILHFLKLTISSTSLTTLFYYLHQQLLSFLHIF
ncbi:hypothetical protein Pfo_004259 [Paulownia fortunei]|nr:hypothetical protein Pfo_004259 [Paulownia fortunei]